MSDQPMNEPTYRLVRFDEDPLLGNNPPDIDKTLYMSASELWARGQIPTAEAIATAMRRCFVELGEAE